MAIEDKKYSAAKRQLKALVVFSAFMSIVAVGLLIAILVITSSPEQSTKDESEHVRPTNDEYISEDEPSKPQMVAQPCPSPTVVHPPDVNNPTVFQDLSPAEIQSVIDYLFNQSDFNLVAEKEATVNSSYIFSIELFLPSKESVLKHLDQNDAQPTRSAFAVIFREDLPTPVVEEYQILPLPNPTAHMHNPAHSYTRYPIPYDARPMSPTEYVPLENFVYEVAENLEPLLIESYGYGVDCDDKCIFFDDITQFNIEGQVRQSVFMGLRDLDGHHLHPLGIDIVVSHPGADITKWKVERIIYNNQLFSSVEDLMANINTVNKTSLPFPDLNGTLYSTLQRKGHKQAGYHQAPRMFQMDGPRYKIIGQKVEYMDWNFHFRLRPTRNIQLLDIKFKNKRIAYEISLQDISSFYSGHGLSLSSALYLDLSSMLNSFELVKGIDCPLEASYIDANLLVYKDTVSRRKNVICIFEQNLGSPLTRHYDSDYNGGYYSYGGVQDNFLVLRTIMTNYNKDILLDFCFHNNGVINVKSTLTGYIMATYDLPEERKYGFPVRENVVGTIRHNMYNFKVDLDVEGRNDRFATYDIALETVSHPWIANSNLTQARIHQSLKESELEARVLYEFDKPQLYVIYSNNSTNSYGSNRGYQIVLDGTTKLLLPDQGAARSLRWGKYQIAVTKYNDSELYSSSIYAVNSAFDPLIDFDQYLENDESIVDEDLVMWVTVGGFHVPRSEDVPTVSTTGETRSFYLRPFNYFDEDASVTSKDAVYITPDEDGSVVNEYGRPKNANCLPRKFGPLQYDGTW